MKTSQDVVNSKLYGYNEDAIGHENERALHREDNYSEPHEDTAQNLSASLIQHPNTNEYGSNEIQQMLMMLQAQQFLANSGSVHQQSPHPDLNSLVANQVPNQLTQDIQKFVSHSENKTPNDVKLATQRQLADL